MNFFGRRKTQAPSSGTSSGGGGSKPAAADPSVALQQVKNQVSVLEKRIEHLEKRAEQQLKEAKRLSLAKNRSGAMQALKRKKMHEKEIAKLRNAVANLEQQAFSIENASTTIDIIQGMKAGRAAAQKIQQQVNIEDVEDLKDDIAEQLQTQNEIDDILATQLGDVADDDELMAELEELDAEEEDELNDLDDELEGLGLGASKASPPSYSEATSLPSAPTSSVKVPTKKKVEEEDEDAKALAALEAEMAM
mmetsp:Transcript_2564/g.5940  ORF Transcript_2564/g.5940 Transcript_2564/m.5940 type:complete len:250 (-) Transcript_2564:229-978(-)|eukprot:CAMPEP_0171497226 /NCGR_PEP_ID=MMETSP0958-20121227/7146_1 /TAXON_ID=87120 /ORGANISM="Aurantiochytrium limacinum, Strain ATCCMYA-1381" /LENGTH=249 /DNA_ID=CAMNT_0012031429 /DNA_START=533 /DNA_END=1282 /DNA_ORIENTATION=+